MSGREPEFAEFAPERLTTGSRRRLDPVAIGAVVMVAGLALAIVKPWGGEEARVDDARTTTAVASQDPVAGTTHAPTVPEPAVASRQEGAIGLAEPLLGWSVAGPALREHEGWGIRTLIADPDHAAGSADTEVVERWTEIRADRSPTKALHLLSGDRAILALGLTFPSDDVPLDARLWRELEDGWEWLDAEPLAESDEAGAFLFSPPRVGGGYLATWPPGRYRVEWLGANGIEQVGFRIAGRFAVSPSLAPLRPPDRDLPSPLRPVFRVETDERLFEVTRGVASGLPAPGTVPLNAVRVWQEAVGAPVATTRPEVAAAFLPETNGLGVLLPRDAKGADGSIVSLGPDSAALDAQRIVGIRFEETGRSPYVIFRAPDGGTWLPGVYRLDVSWTGPDGPRRTSYHLEVRPGP